MSKKKVAKKIVEIKSESTVAAEKLVEQLIQKEPRLVAASRLARSADSTFGGSYAETLHLYRQKLLQP